MIKEIIDSFKNKKIAILGFGLEGKSTYYFIRKYLPEKEVDILFESKNKSVYNDPDFVKAKDDEFVNFIIGNNYLDVRRQMFNNYCLRSIYFCCLWSQQDCYLWLN